MARMMDQTPPPSMGKMFGKGPPETVPPDSSGKTPKQEAFYIHPPGNCGSCSHFIQGGGGGGDCELVDKSSDGFDPGSIDPAGYCCLYEPGGGSQEPEEKAEAAQPGRQMPMWETYEEPEEVAA